MAANRPAPHPEADHPWRTGKAWTAVMQLQDAKVAGSKQGAAAEAQQHGVAAGDHLEAF